MKRKDGLPTADAKSSRSFENIYPVFISESSAVSRAVTVSDPFNPPGPIRMPNIKAQIQTSGL